jgi:predicted amidohydrolase YtcJ
VAADLIVLARKILTLGPARPAVTALAVAGGRVAALGRPADVRRWRDRRTQVLEFPDATIVPGLVDAHAHLDREGLKLLYPSLARCRSIADIQRVIREVASATKPGEWIVTMPVGAPPFYMDVPQCLQEQRWPTRADLDAAAPHHPVYIRGIWGYWNKPPVYSIASSAALRRAGITRHTVPPKGVEILIDAAGEPTGVFVETNLIQVIELTLMKDAPRFTSADRRRALARSQAIYASRGVTAIYEGHGIAPEVLDVYRSAHEQGELKIRATLAVSPTWDGTAEAARAIPDLAAWAGGRGLGDDQLRVVGICLHHGGDADVARILHEAQPYTAWAGFVESANSPEAYRAQAELAARHGLRINTLVTRGLDAVLDAWESIDRTTPIGPLRWVAVHLHVATARQLARLKRLGAVATTNPISYLWRSAAEEVARNGGDGETLIPHRALAAHRIPFGIATDNKPPNPWMAFRTAIERRDLRSGEVCGAGQRLTRRQALQALTVGGAWVTLAERDRGTLAVGRAADFAVLDGDPLTAPIDDVDSLHSRLTVVGGRVVHRAR